MAILGGGGPDTLPDFLDRHHVQLLWHPSLSPEPPSEVTETIPTHARHQLPGGPLAQAIHGLPVLA